MNTISSLPYMPVQTAWIEQHPAFCEAQYAHLLPAVLKLMFAAWRGLPAGSIPASHSYIASATGLALDVVSREFVTLTHDYVLGEDGRLHHGGLSRVCGSVASHYGKEIESFAMSLLMASQSPEEFAVASHEAANTKRPRGKTAIPRDWNFVHDPELVAWVASLGMTEKHQQEWICARFRNHCLSRDLRSKNFEAEFRLFAENTAARFSDQIPPAHAVTSPTGSAQGVRPPGASPFRPGGMSPFRNPGLSKGEEAQGRAKSAFEMARARMGKRAAGAEAVDGAPPEGDFIDVDATEVRA